MAENNPSNNKRIAKNTIVLYIRMLFNLVVSLYTSRVVLQVLGVNDFGVYTVVGSILGMIGFLNASMSGATSRFLTYDLGVGVFKKLSITFNSALVVHIGIAIIVFIFGETIGLWILLNKINIPDGRLGAAIWIYELSILSAMVGITQVPYNACIIAHERLDIYAYVEIARTILKLIIVYLLQIINHDKLIVYGILLFCISISFALYYRLYCIHRFKEAHFQLCIDKKTIRQILSFSGYNLFGNFGSIFNRQGTVIIINNFFGVAINAACGVATTVSNVITSFANQVITVFRPPITKAYARKEITEVKSLTVMALKLALFILCLCAIPAIVEMDFLFKLWLVEVPESSSLFARLIIIAVFFSLTRYIITIDIHATGKIRYVSLFNGILLSMNPIFIYIILSFFHQVYLAFICEIVAQMILSIIVIFLSKRYIPQLSIRDFILAVFSILLMAVITYLTIWKISLHLEENMLRLLITVLESSVLFSSLCYFICLNRNQRTMVNNYVKKTILRKK